MVGNSSFNKNKNVNIITNVIQRNENDVEN